MRDFRAGLNGVIEMILSQLWSAHCASALGATLAATLGLSLEGFSAAQAESAQLVGSWAGNGSINFASGSKESSARTFSHDTL
jgi:hypothetical protein